MTTVVKDMHAAVPVISSHDDNRARTLARLWQWAADLKQGEPYNEINVWRLELLKAMAERANSAPDLTPSLELKEASVPLPQRLKALLLFLAGVFLALAAFTVWLVRFMPQRGCGVPSEARHLVAVHGEWSTRTRHILRAMPMAQEVHATRPEVVILLGRLRESPAAVTALWTAEGATVSAPAVLPISPRAALAALTDLPSLLTDGWCAVGWLPWTAGLRDWVAIAFRVFQGAVAARWWQYQTVVPGARVVFGITGTADVSLLERAIQAGGGKTVHAVHGQATGPNFVGISNVALFRNAHDAECYRQLRCYGACEVQRAEMSIFRRGEVGLLLLTNLAHPMNQGFVRHGIRDEQLLISEVAKAARMLAVPTGTLFWKPHPVLDTLPAARELEAAAAKAGFTRLSAVDVPMHELAGNMRWVISTPSTVALDLLEKGILPVMVDPQATLLGTALDALPMTNAKATEMAACLGELDVPGRAAAKFTKVFATIGPARSFDLKTLLD